jgi:hypothetical protein
MQQAGQAYAQIRLHVPNDDNAIQDPFFFFFVIITTRAMWSCLQVVHRRKEYHVTAYVHGTKPQRKLAGLQAWT